jgi:hypothetical protein
MIGFFGVPASGGGGGGVNANGSQSTYANVTDDLAKGLLGPIGFFL